MALAYQWQRSNNGGASWADISGATSSSYNTPATTLADNGARFRCRVTDTDSGAFVNSNAAILTVGGPTVTDVDTDEVITSTQTGATFSGTALGATTGDRTVRLVQGAVSITQSQTGGNNDGGSFDVVGFADGGLGKYGAAVFTVTTSVGDSTLPITINAPADRNYVQLTSINTTAANRITALPDLAIGDQIEASAVVGGTIADVTLNPDGTFTTSAGVTSFSVRVQDGTAPGWSTAVTQAIIEPIGQPTGLVASNIQPTSATISWAASANATAYIVVVNGVTQGTQPSSTSLNISGLSPGVQNTVTVQARDGVGNLSAVSSALVFWTTVAVPTGVSAGSITTTSATLVWNAVAGAASYRVRVNGTVFGSDRTVANVTLTGLTPATAYNVTIAARNGNGDESAESSPVASFVTLTAADTVAPSWVGAVGLSVSGVAQTTASATCNAATDNVGVTAYRWRLNGVIQSPDTATPSKSLTGLTASTNYTLTVSALDAAGNESTQSPGVSFTTTAAPDTTPPSWTGAVNLVVTGISDSGASASCAAATDNIGVTAYRWRLNGIIQAPDTASPSKSFTGLTPDTQYSLTVAARDAAGNESTQSAAVNFRTQVTVVPPPAQPSNVAVVANSVTTNAAQITWNTVSNAASYRVRVNGVAITPDTITPPAQLSNLTPGAQYFVTVASRDAAGTESAQTTAISFTTLSDTTTPTTTPTKRFGGGARRTIRPRRRP